MSAKNVYKKFHGRAVRYVKKIFFREPKRLVYLGRVRRIEYLSDKSAGGGDGRPTVFYHDFKRGVYLYTDEHGQQLYILKNGKEYTQVTERGIIS
jgi:hypothetical protein